MKAIKTLVVLSLMSGFSQAATITVTSGLPAQGFTVTQNSLATTQHFVGVGSWDSVTSTFSQFSTSAVDTAKVNGTFVATGPTSFNNKIIDVFVGTGADIASSGTSWIIFRSTAATAFPSDVSGTDAVTFAATIPSVLTIVGRGDAGNGFVGQTINFAAIPEPSVALLGALGLIGLVRRRR